MAPNKKLIAKKILIYFLLFLGIMWFMYHFNAGDSSEPPKHLTFTEFIQAIEEEKRILSVEIHGEEIRGKFNDDRKFITFKESGYELTPFLKKHKIPFENVYKKDSGSGWMILFSWLPFVLIFVVIFFMFRKMSGQGQGGAAMKFTAARAYQPQAKDMATFDDVAGIEEVKARLMEVVDYLKTPKRYTCLGGKVPAGVLLTGPPGTGKTLLARAVAGEAEASFLCIAGSDFVELYVGVGASRVRNLFEQARKSPPCIIFIDEIDAVGRHRGTGHGGGHDEREQTLNQILKEMDGFEQNAGIIIIAASNRPDVLDPALLRPGRFDLKIEVPLPDINGREGILKVHVKGKKLAESVNLSEVARGTSGFSGADLENLANEAALCAARKNKKEIDMEDFREAKERIILGEQRKLHMSEKEKTNTAYHESGHTLMHFAHKEANPVELVSIIPRNRSLGVTWSLPTEDRYSMTKEQLEAHVLLLLGGRAAEEEIFGKDKITTGAKNDLDRATELVRRMIAELGMDEEFGLASFDTHSKPFLGRELALGHGTSELTKRKIEQLTNKRLKEQYEKARHVVKKHQNCLHDLAKALLEKETLNAEEIKKIIGDRINIMF